MDEIEELENILDTILRGVQDALQAGEILSEEFQAQVAEEINLLTNEIDSLYQQRERQQQPEQPPQIPTAPTTRPLVSAPAPSAQLMWILAGQNPEAFVSYLATYPDPELKSLLRNPSELERTINFLSQMMPQGEQPSTGGIQHAPINSSNIYGFRYNPKNGQLLVRFQSGSIYKYDGVPAPVFNAFSSGAVPAKTNGQNQWGRWWVGKIPSLGAAFYNLIRQAGYPYSRLS